MKIKQANIISALNIAHPFNNKEDIKNEIERRVLFIENCLTNAYCESLVLGISGGVDSSTCGKLCQIAIDNLRTKTGNNNYNFIAVRLPYGEQFDEADAQKALQFINADIVETVNIKASVDGMFESIKALQTHKDADFIKGNIKARARMIAQYALAGAKRGLVVGTDHGAEALTGFFTKFGDGACDLAPLSGLTKSQVREIADCLGAPTELVHKTPTADLEDNKPGNADENALGFSYENIDKFLQNGEVIPEVMKKIINQYEKTEHKRNLPLVP